jgi:hypothetical protein
MAELSEDEKQSLDDALSTLDDLYEAALEPDGGLRSEQMEAIAKLAEEAMGRCCPCWTRKCTTRVSATVQKENWGAKLGPSGP